MLEITGAIDNISVNCKIFCCNFAAFFNSPFLNDRYNSRFSSGNALTVPLVNKPPA